jgi:hypothetical protein
MTERVLGARSGRCCFPTAPTKSFDRGDVVAGFFAFVPSAPSAAERAAAGGGLFDGQAAITSRRRAGVCCPAPASDHQLTVLESAAGERPTIPRQRCTNVSGAVTLTRFLRLDIEDRIGPRHPIPNDLKRDATDLRRLSARPVIDRRRWQKPSRLRTIFDLGIVGGVGTSGT